MLVDEIIPNQTSPYAEQLSHCRSLFPRLSWFISAYHGFPPSVSGQAKEPMSASCASVGAFSLEKA